MSEKKKPTWKQAIIALIVAVAAYFGYTVVISEDEAKPAPETVETTTVEPETGTVSGE